MNDEPFSPAFEELVERLNFSKAKGLYKAITMLLPLMKRGLKKLEETSWNQLNRTRQESLSERGVVDNGKY
jgi:hypothetical protein